jgi:RNA polymerase sigma-70 factor (ECF subfamily)
VDALEDAAVVARLRDGDEATFARLVDEWGPLMLRLARLYVSTVESAQDVVQETWLAVLAGLHRFEARSSLRTWVFRILVNRAKTRGVRERRTVPWNDAFPQSGPTVHPARFQGYDGEYPGHWRQFPAEWPESATLAGELRKVIGAALDRLAPQQRAVIELRDVRGYSAEETCTILGISAGNQRVLLHRARASVRSGIEDYFWPASEVS